MTKTEFRQKLAQTKNTKWFNSVEIHLRYVHLNLNLEFKGFGHIHRFVSQQINGWEKITEKLPNELRASKKHFEFIENHLVNFIISYGNEESAGILEGNFRSPKNQIQSHTGINFTYDCPETEFLINVHKNHTQSFIGAYTYLIGNLSQNMADKNNFNGYLLAYEFTLRDTTQIAERRNKEKSALSKLRNDFQNSLSILDSELVDHLKNSTEKYKEFGAALDLFKEDKEKTYSDWFINSKGDYENFSKKSDARIKELENTYKEKLKLEEPALYWSERASKLKKQGWIALAILVGLILIIVYSLGKLLWTTPEQIYVSFFDEDKSAAIRWSIIYITFISFMVLAIRAITKVMFSSFHLARDCEERYTLTYFYLSLLKDSKVENEEKQLVMQSLFSRAETGLLKDDSSPTMPNDIVGKFISK